MICIFVSVNQIENAGEICCYGRLCGAVVAMHDFSLDSGKKFFSIQAAESELCKEERGDASSLIGTSSSH